MADPCSGGADDPYRESLGRLMVEIAHRLRTRVGPVFSAVGLKPRQVDLLRTLARRESTTQQELVEALGVDPSVLVGLLNDLERDGAVRRIRDPKDRRRHLVEITAEGLVVLQHATAEIERAELAVFAVLAAGEQERLRLLLGAVRTGLDAAPRDCDR